MIPKFNVNSEIINGLLRIIIGCLFIKIYWSFWSIAFSHILHPLSDQFIFIFIALYLFLIFVSLTASLLAIRGYKKTKSRLISADIFLFSASILIIIWILVSVILYFSVDTPVIFLFFFLPYLSGISHILSGILLIVGWF